MPCRSDYMEPNNRERQLQETAQLTVYVLTCQGEDVPAKLINAAQDRYCREDYVPLLCSLMTEIEQDPALMDIIVYDGRSIAARRLAEWWERHKEADRKRLAAEQAATNYQALIEQTWTDATQTVWPRAGDYASVSAESITKFAQSLLDKVKK